MEWILVITVLLPLITCAVFVALKLVGTVTWTWFAVFSPVLAMLGLVFLVSALFPSLAVDKPNLEGLPPEKVVEEERRIYIESQLLSGRSWMFLSWIFGGFWHWVFGETDGSSFLWSLIYWTVQIGSILLGGYLFWRHMNLVGKRSTNLGNSEQQR